MNEVYELQWAGKAKAREQADTPATGHLEEAPGAAAGGSGDGDDPRADGEIIEGDNLDVLKLLQPEHAGRIDLVYIDPPYNTGSSLVYADHLRAPRSGGRGATGRAAHRHAGWLNMMYPRLVLARRLLREEGAILVSIDDRELPGLRCLLDEVYGEENYEGTFTWQTKRAARGVPPANLLVQNHEYIVCYSKARRFRFRGHDRAPADFSNADADARGPWRSESMKATGRADNWFDIVDPTTGHAFHGNWAFSPATLKRMITEGLVLFPPTARGVPRQKKFMDTYRHPTKAIVTNLGWFSTEQATATLMTLFGGDKVFDFPKPAPLMEALLDQALPHGGTVLDFFAGSGTTAEAVLRLNARDGGGRRYILVQRGEPTGRADLPTIADVTRERVRRTVAAMGGRAAGFRARRLVEGG